MSVDGRAPVGQRLWQWRESPDGGIGDAQQLAFDDLGTALIDVVFVVVDLETTGGSAANDAITEIGAVKVRGGEVLGEFQTLVNPGTDIPPYITVLTGITTAMVAPAPGIAEVLPAFLEFAAGAVLVAHNAGFDIGFLKAASARHGYSWPQPTVIDTVALARRAVPRGEVPNHKLSTLAAHLHARTSPTHRALDDARATVDVLHAIIGRLAAYGVMHLADLTEIARPVPLARARKRSLADAVPAAPGVYQFIDAHGEVLYVGTSKNMRARVRTYFTAAERRARMNEMVMLAERVHAIECATPLEAAVRELRLIAEKQPRYNRRSRRQDRLYWAKLTNEPYPRLSVTGKTPREEVALGPFTSQSQARTAVEAIHLVSGLRECTKRLPRRPADSASACMLHGLGRCCAPCISSSAAESDYSAIVAEVAAMIRDDPSPLVAELTARIERNAAAKRYEEAADNRDRLAAFLSVRITSDAIAAFAGCAEIVAARRRSDRSWEIVLIRYAKFAGALVVPAGIDPMPQVGVLQVTGDQIPPPDGRALPGSFEEAQLLLSWLTADDVRLVAIDGEWCAPRSSAAAHEQWLRRARRMPMTASPD